MSRKRPEQEGYLCQSCRALRLNTFTKIGHEKWQNETHISANAHAFDSYLRRNSHIATNPTITIGTPTNAV